MLNIKKTRCLTETGGQIMKKIMYAGLEIETIGVISMFVFLLF